MNTNMKKIVNSLLMTALVIFTFTSCEDVPSPFGTVVSPKSTTDDSSSEIVAKGSGTEADPYNITAAIEKCKEIGSTESTEKYYVKGIAVTEGVADATYGNASFYMADTADGTDRFYAFQVLGSDGKKMSAGYTINVGDEVVIYGPIYNFKDNTPETAGKGAAYIVTINGQNTSSSSGGDTPSAGDAKGTGTQTDPYNVAGVLSFINTLGADVTSSNEVYIKGKVKTISEQFGTQYGNATFVMIDEGYSAEFTAYSVLYLGNAKYTSGDLLKEGDEVIVCGKVVNFRGNTPETAQNTGYLYSLNGKTEGGNGGGETPSTGEAKGSGTQADPYNVVAITEIASKLEAGQTSESDYYFKGKISTIKYSYDAAHGTGTFFISDDGSTTGEFQVYSALFLGNQNWVDGNTQIKVGDEVVICGKITNYNGTLETASKKAYIYSLNGKTEDTGSGSGGGDNGGGSTASSLTNGGFETWADGQPTGWKSASSASSATLSQSTDAHSGSYSVNVNGKPSSNVRLASQEITLAAGNYTFSFWVKPTSANPAQVRPGYVPVTDGKVGSYIYGDYATLSSGWQQVSYDISLSAETTLCLVVMNPKQSSYSSGEDVLVDDATLTKK